MITKVLGLLIAAVGLFGLPEDLRSLWHALQAVTQPDWLRVLICLLGVLLIVWDKLISLTPPTRKLYSRFLVRVLGLENIKEVAKDRALQPRLNRNDAPGSIGDSVNWSFTALSILSLIRGGILPCWVYDPKTGVLRRLETAYVVELLQGDKFRAGQIPDLLVQKRKVATTLAEGRSLDSLAGPAEE